MAEEAQYDTHKRKYDEDEAPPLPPPRRPTGFSDAPPPPQTASYNHVPPPSMDEFQLAKQKLQEVASRYLNSDPKRSKVDNNGDQKSFASNIQAGNGVSIPSHSYSGSKIIEIPNGRVGVIIGKAGETIKYLQIQSGARIQVTRDADHDPNLPNRNVELMGNQDQIAKAEQLINEVLAEADSGGSGSMSRRSGGASGSEQFVMQVPNNKVGLVIGKGGETIKNIQASSGARVQVIPLHPPPGDMSNERTLQIDGTSDQIEIAKQMVNEVIENRMRNPTMTGGYPQQGYQARPPANWAGQPPQVQQPTGYGYMQQPGTYPGAPSQYNVSQPPYAGYPPNPAASGYTQNWDQSNAQQTQQASQGTGYDYYNQQAPPQQQPPSGPATGAAGYNYNQPQSGGYGQQGYSQDGYGGGYNAPPAQAGYGQPAANPQSGYDQQQGYGSTPGYGGVTNPTGQDGHPPPYGTQGETGQPSANSAYPTHGSNQASYGPPASQAGYGTPAQAQGGYAHSYGPPSGQRTPNAPAYGQPQQSPSQGGGYTQPSSGQPGYPQTQPPAQSGYPSAQSGYGQPDGGAQRAVASSPASYAGMPTQSSAYSQPYGAPPVTPPSYGQHPPAYYGGAYPQQPGYPSDGYGVGTTSAPAAAPAPTAAPASQTAGQPSGAAKTSP